RRQNYAKNAAPTRCAIQFNAPALTLDGPASDGQAQARAAALLARTGLVDEVEPLEHFVSVLRAMPGPSSPRPALPGHSLSHVGATAGGSRFPAGCAHCERSSRSP